MPTFIVHRARIENSLFKKIVEDLEAAMNQYGAPLDHSNEEARSRFLSPVSRSIYSVLLSGLLLPTFHQLFNQIVALFRLTIRNAPESMMPGRIAKKGRVEHQFVVLHEFSILVIEMKLSIGTDMNYHDAIGQVITECDGVCLPFICTYLFNTF